MILEIEEIWSMIWSQIFYQLMKLESRKNPQYVRSPPVWTVEVNIDGTGEVGAGEEGLGESTHRGGKADSADPDLEKTIVSVSELRIRIIV